MHGSKRLLLNSLAKNKHCRDSGSLKNHYKSRKTVLRLPLCAAVGQSMQQLRIHDKVS